MNLQYYSINIIKLSPSSRIISRSKIKRSKIKETGDNVRLIKKFISLLILVALISAMGGLGICLGADTSEYGLAPDAVSDELIILDRDGVPLANCDTDKPTFLSMELLDVINETRVQNGLPAFSWSEELYELAFARAQEATRCYSHTRPDGTQWITAYESSDLPDYYLIGENLNKLLGFYDLESVPAKALESWMESGSHRANILSSNSLIGIACVLKHPPTAPYANEIIIVASFLQPQ